MYVCEASVSTYLSVTHIQRNVSSADPLFSAAGLELLPSEMLPDLYATYNQCLVCTDEK